jgi:hypothetical protein
MQLTLAIEVFKIRPRDLDKWDSLEVAEIEAYYLLKDERDKERQAELEKGDGQGRQAPKSRARRRR